MESLDVGHGGAASVGSVLTEAPRHTSDGPPIDLTEADLQYFEQFCDLDSYEFQRGDLRQDRWRDQYLAPPDAAFMPASRDEWLRTRPRWTGAGWFDAPLRPDVRNLLMRPLGPSLTQALALLPVDGPCPDHAAVSSIDALSAGRPGAPCACLIVVAAAWAAVTSWTEARGTRAIVAATGQGVVEIPIDPYYPRRGSMVDPAIEELAPGLRCSPRSAQIRVASSRALMDIPMLITAVESGLISAWAARLITTDLMALTVVERDLVVETLIEKLSARADTGLRNWTTTEVRAATKRLALAIGFDLRRARRAARKGRRVIVQETGLGMAALIADLPADVAHRIYRRLCEIARSQPASDSRCRDQQRADALVDLILEPLPAPSRTVIAPTDPSTTDLSATALSPPPRPPRRLRTADPCPRPSPALQPPEKSA